ncbi:MAG: hypothetical protein ACE5HQ_08400 [Gemmatimonadota bacterium]
MIPVYRVRMLAILAAVPIWAATLIAPARAAAQQPPRTRADSLEARVARLEALVDSLAARLERVGAARTEAAAAPEAAPENDLAALRAAAQLAARAAAPSNVADSVGGQLSRTRSQTQLNPEISMTGDIVGSFASPDEGANDFSAVPREFELSIQSAIDPYTRTKIFLSKEEEFPIAGQGRDPATGTDPTSGPTGGNSPIEVEEGYVYWVGLPAGIGVKLGKFRQEIGLYNRWHTHALLEVERPLATTTFLGDDGLIQTGVSLSAPTFQLGPATENATFEVTRASSDALFDGGGGRLSYLGRVQNFFDLSPSTFLQVGATGVYGENNDESLKSKLGSVDVYFRWAPPGRSLYREFTLKSEYYWADKDFGDTGESGNGGYTQASYRLSQRWIAGLRADYVDGFGDRPNLFQLVPTLTFWQSEWIRLRLQYNYLKPDGLGANHTLLFQSVWSIGPHRHEAY